MNRPGADALPDARAGGDRIFEVSAIAFDLDGTLLDTVADLAAAVNATARRLRVSAPPDRCDPRDDRTGIARSRAPRARACARRAAGPGGRSGGRIRARAPSRALRAGARPRDASLSGPARWPRAARDEGIPARGRHEQGAPLRPPASRARRHRARISPSSSAATIFPRKSPIPRSSGTSRRSSACRARAC